MRKLKLLLLFLLVTAVGSALWIYRAPLIQVFGGVKQVLEIAKSPDPETYSVLIKDLERWRNDLAERHRKARNGAERAAVEADARVILEHSLPAMMRCWLGTPWDFNGTAPAPGEGKIACGYFVATVLRDAGFQVNRYQLAQQPSENIIRSFLPRSSCSLTAGKDYKAFADDVEGLEPGVYVVGLDTHVGFIIVRENRFRFIHSSGSRPWGVVDESRAAAAVLQRSNWRMLGNLTADASVVRRWLRAEKIAVRGT